MFEANHLAAHRRLTNVPEALEDLLDGDLVVAAGGDCGQRVQDVMHTGNWNRNLLGDFRKDCVKAGLFQAHDFNILRPDVRAFRESEGDLVP